MKTLSAVSDSEEPGPDHMEEGPSGERGLLAVEGRGLLCRCQPGFLQFVVCGVCS